MVFVQRKVMSSENSNKKLENRPKDTAFFQQRYPAYQPTYKPRFFVPIFIISGLIFLPIGLTFLLSSRSVWEINYDYSACTNAEGISCSTIVPEMPCYCDIKLKVNENIDQKVFVYYGLENFYQNHRLYARSKDFYQLFGYKTSLNDVCEPFKEIDGKPVAPCGAIANSLFNDTIVLSGNNVPVEDLVVSRKNIAWATNLGHNYQNPEPKNDLKKAFENNSKPPSWKVSVDQLDPDDVKNNGYENEALIVWMETAAFANFRKLYGTIEKGLKQGTYDMNVSYNFPVVDFGGKKRIVFSTINFFGGKNNLIGQTYLITGVFMVSTGFLLLIVNKNRTSKPM